MRTKEQSGERVAAELATWFGEHFDVLDMSQQDFGVQWEERAGESFTASTLSSRVSELKNGNSKGITFFLSKATRREAFLDMLALERDARQDAEDLIERYFEISRGDARSIAVVIDLQDSSSPFLSWFGGCLATLASEAKGRVVIVLSQENYVNLPRGWDDFADFEQIDFETDTAFLEWCRAEASQAVVVSSRVGIPWSRWIAIDFKSRQMYPDSLAELRPDVTTEHPILDVCEPTDTSQDATVFESLGMHGIRIVEQRRFLDDFVHTDESGEIPFVTICDRYGYRSNKELTLEQRARVSRLFSLPLSSTAEERERARNEAEVEQVIEKLSLEVKRIKEEELGVSREVLRWGELTADALAIDLEKGRLKLVTSTIDEEHIKVLENSTAIEHEIVEPIESGFFDWFLQELAEWTAADTHVDPTADRIYEKLLERTRDKHISGYFRARFIQSIRERSLLEGGRLEEGAMSRLQSILSSELPEVEISLSHFDNLGACYAVDDCVVPVSSTEDHPLAIALYADLHRRDPQSSRTTIRWGVKQSRDENRLSEARLDLRQNSSIEHVERGDELRSLANMRHGEFEWDEGWRGRERRITYDRSSQEEWASLDIAPPIGAANDLASAVLDFLRLKLSGEGGLATSDGFTLFGEQFGGSIRVKVSEHPLSEPNEKTRLIIEGCVATKTPERDAYGHVVKAATPVTGQGVGRRG